MSDHTKGPWGIFNHNGTICIDNRGGDGQRPCIVDWTGFDTNDMSRRENEANAKLISAAPELLEALQKIVNNWDNLHPKDRKMAREAIAKATKS